MHNFNIRI